VKSRNVTRRPISLKQKRRSFFSWFRPERADSTARKLHFESLEDRRVLAITSTLAGTTASVTSDAASDTITVTQSAGLLLLNGSIDWDTTAGGDQTLAAAAGSRVDFIDLGDGDDVVNLGAAGSAASTLLANFTFSFGGPGNDALNIDDGSGAAANDYIIDDGGATNSITATGINISLQGAFFENGITLTCSNLRTPCRSVQPKGRANTRSKATAVVTR
jgi:hypothetical protein